MSQQVLHPMAKFQRQIRALVESRVIQPTDKLGKVALLYGSEWPYWKQELEDFQFSMHDPVSELLGVEDWDDE
jgi:hypothetical protein